MKHHAINGMINDALLAKMSNDNYSCSTAKGVPAATAGMRVTTP
jgi:hypothetical protein